LDTTLDLAIGLLAEFCRVVEYLGLAEENLIDDGSLLAAETPDSVFVSDF
jgi:hypothetical protein